LGASLVKTEADRAIIAAVKVVAGKLGRSMAKLAYAWAATRAGVTAPIYGISKLEQFDDALASLTLRLDPEDFARMEPPYVVRPIAGHPWSGPTIDPCRHRLLFGFQDAVVVQALRYLLMVPLPCACRASTMPY
jgi:hypothetical protein